jgi:hypothetical protein
MRRVWLAAVIVLAGVVVAIGVVFTRGGSDPAPSPSRIPAASQTPGNEADLMRALQRKKLLRPSR